MLGVRDTGVLSCLVMSNSSLSVRFFQQEYWSGFPCPSPGDITGPGIECMSPASPPLAGGFFTTAPPGKPLSAETRQHLNVWDTFLLFFNGMSRLWQVVILKENLDCSVIEH